MYLFAMNDGVVRPKRLPDDVFQELIDQLFTFRTGIVTGVVMIATLGLVICTMVGGFAPVALTLAGTLIGVLRFFHSGSYQARRARGPMRRREMERWDREFAIGNILFGLNMGVLSGFAIVVEEPYLNSIGYAMCFAYGSGTLVRNGFRARATMIALVVITAPMFVCIGIDAFDKPSFGHTAMNLQLGFLLLALVLGGMVTAQTAQQVAEERLLTRREYFKLAHSDPLTGSANRLRLAEAFDAAVAAGEPVALHCLDLDRFKPVNDRLGHAAGDALLIAVAERTRALLRSRDTLARTGGDEFVVLQIGAAAEEDAIRLATRIRETITNPFPIAGEAVSIGISIGSVMVWPGATLDQVTSVADQRLYQAKARNREPRIRAV